VRPTRRHFLRTLAAAPLLPALGDAPAATPSPTPAPRAVDASARLLAQVIEQRYGAQLEAGDLDVITKGIGDALEGAARLRALRLGNADEPVTLFHARPPGSAGHSAAIDAVPVGASSRRAAAEFTSARARRGSGGDGAVPVGASSRRAAAEFTSARARRGSGGDGAVPPGSTT
jgi:hypothetical protein